MKQTIIIQKKATIQATGEHINKNNKPVICLTTGEFWSSSIDASKSVGVHPATMSAYCTGKYAHPEGLKFCYVTDLPQHLNELSSSLTKYWENEKERYFEDRRREIEEQERIRREKELDIAQKRVERHQKRVDSLLAELKDAQNTLIASKNTYASLLKDEVPKCAAI